MIFPLFPAPDFSASAYSAQARESADWAARMELEFAAMRDAQRLPTPQPEPRPCAR